MSDSFVSPASAFGESMEAAASVESIVRRKTGLTGQIPGDTSRVLQNELYKFLDRLGRARLVGLAVDFDGTIRSDSDGPNAIRPEILEEILRLAGAGLPIGVATGRGQSAASAFREALPRNLWNQIVVGYYHGAVVLPLTQDLTDMVQDDALDFVVGELERYEPFRGQFRVMVRPFRVALAPLHHYPMERAMTEIRELIYAASLQDRLRVMEAGRTIDIIPRHVNKATVRSALLGSGGTAGVIREGDILAIGDQGQWGGNDYELLREDFGLSVDRVSTSPLGCWNLAPDDVTGPDACFAYLRSLTLRDGKFHFDMDVIRKWWAGNEV